MTKRKIYDQTKFTDIKNHRVYSFYTGGFHFSAATDDKFIQVLKLNGGGIHVLKIDKVNKRNFVDEIHNFLSNYSL